MTKGGVNRALGSRVKQIRLLRGMTQPEVVKGYRGSATSALSFYESGKRAITVYRLLQISEILRVEPTAWLLGEQEWNKYVEAL